MGRYKLRYFSDISGRIYLMYRDEIWAGYNRSEDIRVGERKSWKYIYLPSPVEDSRDLFSLIWLAAYKNKIVHLTYNEARERVARECGGTTKLRNGEYILLRNLSYEVGTNIYSLVLSTNNVLEDVKFIRQGKKRVTRLPAGLLSLSSKAKLHPLCYVFARSSLYYIKRNRGRENDQD